MKHLKTYEATGTYIANQTKFEKKIIDKCRELGLDADDLEVFTHGKQSVKAHHALAKWRLVNKDDMEDGEEFHGELFDTKRFSYHADIEIIAKGDTKIAECMITMLPTGMNDKFDMGCMVASQAIVDALLDGAPPSIADSWDVLSDEDKKNIQDNKEFF